MIETHERMDVPLFPPAHRTAKTIMVLYSEQDNILGPHRNKQDAENDEGDLLETVSGWRWVGGIYTVAQRAGVPMVRDKDMDMFFAPWGMSGLYRTWAKNLVGDSWDSFEKALNDEIQQDPDGLFTDNLKVRDYEKALPLAYVLRVNRQISDDFYKTIKALIKTDYTAKIPRPAMGYGGLEGGKDVFIERLIRDNKIIPVDQTKWLFSHSGMKIPSRILFHEVYELRIMDLIRRTTGFGKY